MANKIRIKRIGQLVREGWDLHLCPPLIINGKLLKTKSVVVSNNKNNSFSSLLAGRVFDKYCVKEMRGETYYKIENLTKITMENVYLNDYYIHKSAVKEVYDVH